MQTARSKDAPTAEKPLTEDPFPAKGRGKGGKSCLSNGDGGETVNFLERLEYHSSRLTNTERKISDYVLAHQAETVRVNIAELAELCGASRSAVLRFTQKLGYSGFTEFRYDFSLFVHAGLVTQEESANRVQQVASYYETAVRKISECVDDSRMGEIAQQIIHARRVKIFGMNRNGYSAQQLRHHFHTLNFDAEAVTEAVLVRDLSAAGRAGDVHIYFSVSGETPVIREAIRSSFQQGVTTVLITMHRDSQMAPYATYQVVLPTTRMVTTDYFLDQQAINFVFIEILIVFLGSSLAQAEEEPGGGQKSGKP